MDDTGVLELQEKDGWLEELLQEARVEKEEDELPRWAKRLLAACTRIWKRLLRESEEQRKDDSDQMAARLARLENSDDDRKAEIKKMRWEFEMLQQTLAALRLPY